MTIGEMLQELGQPEQRKRHFARFKRAIVVMVLEVVVFCMVLAVGGLLLHIRWTGLTLGIGIVGGVVLWVWMHTDGRVE